MLTTLINTMPKQDDALPIVSGAKSQSKDADEVSAAASDFNLLLSQLLGAAIQNTQQSVQNNEATVAVSGEAATPALQPVVGVPAKQPDNAFMFLGISASDTVPSDEPSTMPATAQASNDTAASVLPTATQSPDTTSASTLPTVALDSDDTTVFPLPTVAADSKDTVVSALPKLAQVSEDRTASQLPTAAQDPKDTVATTLPRAAQVSADTTVSPLPLVAKASGKTADFTDKIASEFELLIKAKNSADDGKTAVSAKDPSDNTGADTTQEKTDFHELLAKQASRGVVADDGKVDEIAIALRNNTVQARNEMTHTMPQGSSGEQNVQAQITGATVTHVAHEVADTARFRAMDPADILDNATTIMKDGNRLAVRFEQDGLGKLNIDLSMNKGMINAHIQAADSATKALIENNMQQIVDSLLKAGLSVGGFSVSLKGGGQGSMAQEEYHGYKTGQAAGSAGTAGGSSPIAASNNLVSIFI